MNRILSLLLFLVASATAWAQSEAAMMPELPLDPEVRHGKLANGLTYYVRHNKLPENRVCFYIAQKVGSVQEEDNQRGLAHFLEHMCFNGTAHFPDDALIKYCERIGVKFGQNLNAYTSTDETVYNIDDVPALPGNIDSCLLILKDWSNGLTLAGEEIDKERGVIHEEWRMVNGAARRLFTRNMPNMLPGSRYAYRMPIGTLEVIDNFPHQELRDYYHKWYRPDLQGIIIVGDIDAEKVEARIKELFSDIVMPENAAKYEHYPVPSTPSALYIIDKDKEQPQAVISYNWKNAPLPEAYANTEMNIVFSSIVSGAAAMLNARLEELSKKEDCPFLYAGTDYGKYMGVAKTMEAFQLTILPKPGQDAAASRVALEEVERVRQHGFTATELARIKESTQSTLDRIYSNRDKQKHPFFIDQYVRHFLENTPAMSIEERHARYAKILPALRLEMYDACIANLTASIDSNFVCYAAYPDKDGQPVPTEDELRAAVAAARAAQLEAYVDNVKDEPLIPVLPEKGRIVKEKAADFGFTCWTLENGARVFFKKTDFNNAQVILRATSLGGKSLLPDSCLIATKLFGNVIGAGGVGNFTATELQKKLAGKQVGLGVGLGQTTESISGSSTPKDLRTLFELLYLHFRKPLKDTEAYNSTIATLKTSLENAEKKPETSFSDSITATLYDHNPMLGRLTRAELERADYDEILRIYAERFNAGGDFDFFFIGAFDEDSLRAYTEQYIAPLKGVKKREKFVNKKFYPVTGVVNNHFKREMEVPQAFLFQLWGGQTPYSLKKAAVVNAFGEILDTRCMKSIREDAGFAYSVSAGASASFGLRDEYALSISCPIKPEAQDSVLILIREAIEDIAVNGVTEEELGKVKAFEEKNYADNQKNNGYWLGLIMQKTTWNKNLQKGYIEAIRSVSSDDIRKFARKTLLKQGNCVTVTMLPLEQ